MVLIFGASSSEADVTAADALVDSSSVRIFSTARVYDEGEAEAQLLCCSLLSLGPFSALAALGTSSISRISRDQTVTQCAVQLD